MGRRKQRASVGFALIAKDSEKTLGRCLDSIRPYVSQIVVGVDENTVDATGEVAVKHGADLVFPLAVSGWHECPRHGRVLAQHFAEARNASFRHLDPALKWWAWIDADDVLKGGEFLKEIAEDVPQDVNCVWAPYNYATVHNGAATTTLFDRERLLRPRAGWVWTHRVHETVAPTREPLAPVRTERLAWFHQEGVHKTEASTTRNHLLLEIDLEERPDDPRTVFYVANGYFAQQKWAEAAAWYERLTQLGGDNEYELWQSYVYMAAAYQQVGDLDSATRAAFCAIDVVPDHPEPYFRLAAIYLAAGQFGKVLKWDGYARTKTKPPPFVFANPLDYTLNSRTVLADALAQLGRVPEARRALEVAHAAVPDENVGKGIERYRKIEEDARTAQAFVDLASTVDDETALALYAALPPDVKAFGRTRDLAVPILMKKRDARYAA